MDLFNRKSTSGLTNKSIEPTIQQYFNVDYQNSQEQKVERVEPLRPMTVEYTAVGNRRISKGVSNSAGSTARNAPREMCHGVCSESERPSRKESSLGSRYIMSGSHGAVIHPGNSQQPLPQIQMERGRRALIRPPIYEKATYQAPAATDVIIKIPCCNLCHGAGNNQQSIVEGLRVNTGDKPDTLDVTAQSRASRGEQRKKPTSIKSTFQERVDGKNCRPTTSNDAPDVNGKSGKIGEDAEQASSKMTKEIQRATEEEQDMEPKQVGKLSETAAVGPTQAGKSTESDSHSNKSLPNTANPADPSFNNMPIKVKNSVAKAVRFSQSIQHLTSSSTEMICGEDDSDVKDSIVFQQPTKTTKAHKVINGTAAIVERVFDPSASAREAGRASDTGDPAISDGTGHRISGDKHNGLASIVGINQSGKDHEQGKSGTGAGIGGRDNYIGDERQRGLMDGSATSDFTGTPASRNVPSILKYFTTSDDEEHCTSQPVSVANPKESGMRSASAREAVNAAFSVDLEDDKSVTVNPTPLPNQEITHGQNCIEAEPAEGTYHTHNPMIPSETPIDDELADDVSLDEYMNSSSTMLHQPDLTLESTTMPLQKKIKGDNEENLCKGLDKGTEKENQVLGGSMAQAGTEEEKLNREEVQMKSSGGDGETLKRERKPTPWIKDSNNQPTPDPSRHFRPLTSAGIESRSSPFSSTPSQSSHLATENLLNLSPPSSMTHLKTPMPEIHTQNSPLQIDSPASSLLQEQEGQRHQSPSQQQKEQHQQQDQQQQQDQHQQRPPSRVNEIFFVETLTEKKGSTGLKIEELEELVKQRSSSPEPTTNESGRNSTRNNEGRRSSRSIFKVENYKKPTEEEDAEGEEEVEKEEKGSPEVYRPPSPYPVIYKTHSQLKKK